jgi:hypothetical protein
MSSEGIIVGLLAIVIGAAWAFYGLRLFTILLPIWAAFFGLVAGAQLGQDIFGQGFFATVLSWVIGVAVAVAFAVISYFWYYGAITLAIGALGYTLGVGLMAWLGIGDGVLATIVGIVIGGLLAAAAFVLGVPALVVVYVSAISGAAAIVNGVLLFLGRIKVENLDSGLLGGLLTDSFVGVAGWLAISIVAIVYQLRGVGRVAAAIDRSGYRF